MMYEVAEPAPDLELAPSVPHVEIDVASTVNAYERCLRCLHAHDVAPAAAKSDADEQAARALMVEAQQDGRWLEIDQGPRFRVIAAEGTVVSAPVAFELAEVTYRGSYDAVVERTNGSLVLVKYVLSQASIDRSRAQRELMALTYALEHPADAQVVPFRISGLALIGFETRQFIVKSKVEKQLVPTSWTELERRVDRFISFMRVVTRILALGQEPPSAPGCPICRRRRRYDTRKATRGPIEFPQP
jgi:hypothetical protein